MTASTLTIGRLARAADVNVETVRYYQARKLLPIPNRGRSAFRHYPIELVERIRFIKRAPDSASHWRRSENCCAFMMGQTECPSVKLLSPPD